MRTAMMQTGPTTVTGVLLSGAAVWGLAPALAVPVAIGMLLLLALLVLRRRPVALTGLSVVALVSASLRGQAPARTVYVVVTAGLLGAVLLTSLPLTGGPAMRTRTVAALGAAGALVAWTVLTVTGTAVSAGALLYGVGLACLALAYRLAVPPRGQRGTRRGES